MSASLTTELAKQLTNQIEFNYFDEKLNDEKYDDDYSVTRIEPLSKSQSQSAHVTSDDGAGAFKLDTYSMIKANIIMFLSFFLMPMSGVFFGTWEAKHILNQEEQDYDDVVLVLASLLGDIMIFVFFIGAVADIEGFRTDTSKWNTGRWGISKWFSIFEENKKITKYTIYIVGRFILFISFVFILWYYLCAIAIFDMPNPEIAASGYSFMFHVATGVDIGLVILQFGTASLRKNIEAGSSGVRFRVGEGIDKKSYDPDAYQDPKLEYTVDERDLIDEDDVLEHSGYGPTDDTYI